MQLEIDVSAEIWIQSTDASGVRYPLRVDVAFIRSIDASDIVSALGEPVAREVIADLTARRDYERTSGELPALQAYLGELLAVLGSKEGATVNEC